MGSWQFRISCEAAKSPVEDPQKRLGRTFRLRWHSAQTRSHWPGVEPHKRRGTRKVAGNSTRCGKPAPCLLDYVGGRRFRHPSGGGADDRTQRLTQFTGGHVVVEARPQCQTIGNWGHMLGGADGLYSRVIAAFAKQLYGREDMISLSTIRIAPEAFQHEHETMDTLAK